MSLGGIKSAPAPTLRILEMNSLMLNENDAFVGVLNSLALSWSFDSGSSSMHPESSYLLQVANFQPLLGGRRQSSLAYSCSLCSHHCSPLPIFPSLLFCPLRPVTHFPDCPSEPLNRVWHRWPSQMFLGEGCSVTKQGH